MSWFGNQRLESPTYRITRAYDAQVAFRPITAVDEIPGHGAYDIHTTRHFAFSPECARRWLYTDKQESPVGLHIVIASWSNASIWSSLPTLPRWGTLRLA
jgi:hypothetical protein